MTQLNEIMNRITVFSKGDNVRSAADNHEFLLKVEKEAPKLYQEIQKILAPAIELPSNARIVRFLDTQRFRMTMGFPSITLNPLESYGNRSKVHAEIYDDSENSLICKAGDNPLHLSNLNSVLNFSWSIIDELQQFPEEWPFNGCCIAIESDVKSIYDMLIPHILIVHGKVIYYEDDFNKLASDNFELAIQAIQYISEQLACRGDSREYFLKRMIGSQKEYFKEKEYRFAYKKVSSTQLQDKEALIIPIGLLNFSKRIYLKENHGLSEQELEIIKNKGIEIVRIGQKIGVEYV